MWAILTRLALILFIVVAVVAFRNSNHARHDICVSVERMKSAQRSQENEDFSHLRRNLKLLNVRPTPTVLLIAKTEHERKLSRLSPRNCE